ncbi:MAG TPA: GNAT family N-acetyltransferase [Ilumatobacteraceae bacterium]|jgi:GNAT superfamily N-acetyltransferase|nr:GNAT family N-acetyltransferase [Ilumatobacteraceae bacterium]
MEPAALLVVAVDHPSLDGALAEFLGALRDELGRGGHTGSRTPSAELIERLAADRTMRLGVMAGARLVAVVAVDNDGAVALAVARDHRRRGIANDLMEVVHARAAAIGYPPLHRYSIHSRLAG